MAFCENLNILRFIFGCSNNSVENLILVPKLKTRNSKNFSEIFKSIAILKIFEKFLISNCLSRFGFLFSSSSNTFLFPKEIVENSILNSIFSTNPEDGVNHSFLDFDFIEMFFEFPKIEQERIFNDEFSKKFSLKCKLKDIEKFYEIVKNLFI